MPEQLTKHPDVTLHVLRSAGAKCGEGAPQTILTQCPAQRFCKLPGGELCVYGLAEAPQMTQLSAPDWQTVLQALRVSENPQRGSAGGDSILIGGAALLIGLLFGIVLMLLMGRRPVRRP